MARKTKEIRDAFTTVGVATGTDGFRRTALQLGKDISSVDVLDAEGNTVARLNLVVFEDRRANVDIILSPNAERVREAGVVTRAHPTHDHQGQVLRFPGCQREFSALAEDESIVAVTFNYPEKGE